MFHKLKGRLKSETLELTIMYALCVRGKGLYRKKLYINLRQQSKKKKKISKAQSVQKRTRVSITLLSLTPVCCRKV